MFKWLLRYFRESRDELRKVVWPSRRDLVRYTLIVIGFSLFMAIFLGAVDFILTIALEKVFSR